jgi:hypothetical protein
MWWVEKDGLARTLALPVAAWSGEYLDLAILG